MEKFGRVALIWSLAFGVGGVAGLVGCGDDPTTDRSANMDAAYGSEPADAGAADGAPADTGTRVELDARTADAAGKMIGTDATGIGADATVPGADAGAPTSYPVLPAGGWDLLDTGLPAFPPLPAGSGYQSDLYNREAVVPPQCYTRTDGVYNPCYVCHQNPIDGQGRENRMADGDLQGEYSFSDTALTNAWSNLFVDRSAAVAEVDDAAILDYITQDNYTALRPRLIASGWKDVWLPDLWALQEGAAAFDDDGFARDGSGWVAFRYKPMPSTFWPTNGSTDDVMIRLPSAFSSDASGTPSRSIYRANLAILEAAIKGAASMGVRGIDEVEVGVDLDGDASLGVATRVLRAGHYLGGASGVAVSTFLYPKGTEFLHTVRYVGVDEAGSIGVSRRMKEVRYMRKHTFYPKSTLGAFYDQEFQEKLEGQLPRYSDLKEAGLDNKFGWLLRGFIEAADGELRPASYEEGFFCMGCHTTIGSTIDKVFSFSRKIDGEVGWGYIDLRDMPDAPNMGAEESEGEAAGEILTYLRRVGGGAEFRNNPEMAARWYDSDGEVKAAEVAKADVYTLTAPSRERALMLNKAYKRIVEQQQFLRGRDATVVPPSQVYQVVDPDGIPLVPEHRYAWDIRLAWPVP